MAEEVVFFRREDLDELLKDDLDIGALRLVNEERHEWDVL